MAQFLLCCPRVTPFNPVDYREMPLCRTFTTALVDAVHVVVREVEVFLSKLVTCVGKLLWIGFGWWLK